MNKLFAKIATLSVGLAMAVGVGVAVGNNNNFVKAEAAALPSEIGGYTKAGNVAAVRTAISAGKKLLIVGYDGSNTFALPNNFDEGAATRSGTDVTSNSFVLDNHTFTFALTKDSDNDNNNQYSIFGDSKYVYGVSGSNLGFGATYEADTYEWKIESGQQRTIRITNVKYPTRGIIYRKGTVNKFGGYATSNAGSNSTEYFDVEIFIEQALIPSVKIDNTSTEINVSVVEGNDVEKTLTLTALTMNDLTINSSNNKIATVEVDSVNKKITIHGVAYGEADIIIKKGNDTMFTVHVSVSYNNTVTVTAAGGATSVQQTKTLQLTAASSKGEDTFAWSSSNENIATVSSSGVVTGVGIGNVTIRATSNTYTGTYGEKNLAVTFGGVYSRAIFYDENKVDSSSGTTVSSGDTIKNYFSGNVTTISSVSYSNTLAIGKLGGLSLGSGSKTGSFTVTMKSGYYLKSVSLWGAKVDAINAPTISGGSTPTLLNNGGSLAAKSAVWNNDIIPLTWTFSAASQTVTFSCTTSTRFTIYQMDLVFDNITPTSVSLGNDTSATLMVSEQKQLTTIVTPQNYNVSLGIEWKTSNNSVATVSNTGKVTASATGSAVITADGTYGKPTCNITVIPLQRSSVTIRPSTVETLTGASSESLSISGKAWSFSKVKKYDTGDVNDSYTKGCVLLDGGSITNSDKYSFKIKKVIIAHCITQASGVMTNNIVVNGSDTAGGTDISSTNTASGIFKTYTLASAVDYVKITTGSSKSYIASITIEFENPEESIYSISDFILGSVIDRTYENGAVCNTNSIYTFVKDRLLGAGSTVVSNFQTSEDLTVAAARTRYVYWAGNNNDANPYSNSGSGAIAIGLQTETNTVATFIAIIAVVSTLSVGGFFFIRKKKNVK